jgi:hypothetical protein
MQEPELLLYFWQGVPRQHLLAMFRGLPSVCLLHPHPKTGLGESQLPSFLFMAEGERLLVFGDSC